MSVKIRDIRVICTAPEGINLVVVKIETNQPGLYGLGCATFAYRHLTVKHLIEEYMKPLLVGRPVENIEETWQLTLKISVSPGRNSQPSLFYGTYKRILSFL